MIKNITDVGSQIISCSWGVDGESKELTRIFDEIAFQNPNIIFVFAAGNNGKDFGIHSPADSKNVLCVGATGRPWVDRLISTSNFTLRSDNFSEFNAYSENIASYIINGQINEDIEITDDNIFDNVFDVQNNEKIAFITNWNESTSFDTSFPSFFISNPGTEIPKGQYHILFNNVNRLQNVDVAPFSSRGPSIDGLLKPEIVAPGTDIFSASSKFSKECSMESVIKMNGTSLAAPAIAGELALIVQYFKEKRHGLGKDFVVNSQLLRAMIVQSADFALLIRSGRTHILDLVFHRLKVF